ncbi:MAG: hypothetical protein MUE46_05845 [Xanthomonadales bacterium]|jgi:hypothetical protein|nr:hypothetical protein [Xanthomonadales bacterium]
MADRLLLAPALAEAQRQAPTLTLRLSRATPADPRSPGLWTQLAPELALPADGAGAAAALLAADLSTAPDALTGRYVVLTPAWARAEVNGARLLATAERLALTPTEQRAVDTAIAEIARDFGLAPTARTEVWQLPDAAPAGAGLAPPDHALGTDLREALTLSGWWLKLFSEFQVALHGLTANTERGARGLPPVNTIWLHGGGPRPAPQRHWTRVHSHDPLLLGLARLAGMTPTSRAQAELIDARHDGFATALPGFRGSLRCVSGEAWTLSRWDALRVWRRPKGR